MTLGGKPKVLADGLEVIVRIAQQILSPFHLFVHNKLMERHIFRFFENPAQISGGRPQLLCHGINNDLFMKMFKYILLCLPHQRDDTGNCAYGYTGTG